jgi:hypothetical protein
MHITMERQRWAPLIKDYEGGTLMECYINPNINYVEIPATIRKQRMVVEAKINSLTVCAQLTFNIHKQRVCAVYFASILFPAVAEVYINAWMDAHHMLGVTTDC